MSKKPLRSSDLRNDLEAAATEKSLVRVLRRIRRSDKLDGFVVGVGDKWLLLALLDPSIFLNGFVALRLDDVSEVQQRRGIGRSSAAPLRFEGIGRRTNQPWILTPWAV